ncbi:MAG: polysaccharide pyruvyl transferase family protein [Kiritimatiellae bacterium]|nr:polysaccharide pyruvyl transferase family protein [Kiritimatiellia bacterium]
MWIKTGKRWILCGGRRWTCWKRRSEEKCERIIKTKADRETAFRECDFLLHGSGASLVAKRDVIRWAEATGKPYGICGITFSLRGSTATQDDANAAVSETVRVFNGARFVYFRDSVSLELARSLGCTCPVMEFGPDGAFAANVREERKALAFLEENNLKARSFVVRRQALMMAQVKKNLTAG